jgi:hypothetical protein
MNIKQLSEETIGYGHPPRAHQFQPGQSGNPSGRPKGARSLKADLREELDEMVSFADGKHSLQLSKQRVLIKKLVAAALEGDSRAMATVLSLSLRALGQDDRHHDEEAPEDREILGLFAPRAPRRRVKTTSANPHEPKE